MKTIILEGCDNSGKSTLAAELAKLGYRVAHEGPPKPSLTPEGMFRHYLDPLLLAHKRQDLVVFDRLHLGETIYGPVMRGKSQLTELGATLIERYVEAIDGQVVICLPPWRHVLTRWLARRADEYVRTPSQLLQIYRGYQKLLFSARKNRSYLHFDYTRHGVATVAKALATLTGFPLPDFCVGSQRPRFVFVGEKANGALDLPFMSCQNSSAWLHSCLAEAGYLEHELAFANAREPGGHSHNLSQLLTWFNLTPKFIALGWDADRGLNDALIPHHTLGHPQLIRQLKNKERAAYVRTLADIRRGTRTR